MHNIPKWSYTLYSKYCKIFKVCLTILEHYALKVNTTTRNWENQMDWGNKAWLTHCQCNTGSLRKHKPSVPCFLLLSNNYVIKKACSRNITGSTNLAYSEKSTYKSGFPFIAFLRSLTKKIRQNAPTLRQDVVLSILSFLLPRV